MTSIGFQRDSRWMYSASEDGTLKIWDMRAAQAQRTLNMNNKKSGAILSAILHPNQVLARVSLILDSLIPL